MTPIEAAHPTHDPRYESRPVPFCRQCERHVRLTAFARTDALVCAICESDDWFFDNRQTKAAMLDEMYQAMEDAERDFKRPLKWEMSVEAFMDLRAEAVRSNYGTVLLERPQAPEAFGLPIEFRHDMSGWKLKTERQ